MENRNILAAVFCTLVLSIPACALNSIEDKLLSEGAALVHSEDGVIILLGDHWDRFSSATPGKPVVISESIVDAILEIDKSKSVIALGLANCTVLTDFDHLFSLDSLKYLQLDQSQAEKYSNQLLNREQILVDVVE